MIAQVFIKKDNKVLMVKQHVERGDIVWNFPGGGIEEGETPEKAAIREAKEEMLLASTFGEISANNFTEFFPV